MTNEMKESDLNKVAGGVSEPAEDDGIGNQPGAATHGGAIYNSRQSDANYYKSSIFCVN